MTAVKQQMNRVVLAYVALQITGICQPAAPNDLCVAPGGAQGCYITIQEAVDAAPAGSTILVAAGAYRGGVVIGKSLSLLGSGPRLSFINAADQATGVFVDGLHHHGLTNVVVSGFSIHNANFEGMLVANASSVTIQNNDIYNNDLALDPKTPACPGLPPFETDEIFDCGGGLHISGVQHSLISNNYLHNNADGLLVSDDTGSTHDNVITNNNVRENPTDCGIVLASHPPLRASSTAAHFGIYNNLIDSNVSHHNGYQVPGAGAGIGLFADGTGHGRVSGNVISRNTLTDNGLPGVAFHSHVCCDNFSDNTIIGNFISGNGPDEGDTPTPGRTGINISSGFGGTPILGTLITGNVIQNEGVDIAISTPATVHVQDNNLLGGKIGVDNLGSGVVNATNNWWGCAAGPGSAGCSTVSGAHLLFTPWLKRPF